MKKLLTTTFALLFSHLILLAQSGDIRMEAEQMPYFANCEDFEDMTDEKRACSNQALVAFTSQNIESVSYTHLTLPTTPYV